MRIAVMGTGGVGGYFGARLAAAGEDVAFVARGAHLAALRRQGLKVLSGLGDLELPRVAASDDPAEIGPVDLVLFTVKLWDTEAAAEAARPLLGPETAVLPLQNGVESLDVLGRALGRERLLGGVAFIASVIAEPGVIRHTGTMARLVFGEPDGRASARSDRVLEACRRAGITAEVSGDISAALWEKFIFLASLSGLTALARLPVGPLRAEAESAALFADALREVEAVARAAGVAVAPDIVDRHLALFATLPAAMKTSMQQDLERGGRLELPWLSGTVARLGARLGVATPVHRTVAAALAPHAGGAPEAPTAN